MIKTLLSEKNFTYNNHTKSTLRSIQMDILVETNRDKTVFCSTGTHKMSQKNQLQSNDKNISNIIEHK